MLGRAYLYLVITALAWGANAVAGKLAVGHISPMLLTTLRWAMALTIMLCFALPRVSRDRAVIRQNLPLLFAYGAIGFTSFNVLLYSALQYTTAINVVIVQSGMPMVIFLANFAFFHVRVSGAQGIGFALTLAGVLVTASSGSFARLLALEVNFGDALMLVAVLLYGGYAVALRYRPKIHWQSMMTVTAAAAFVTSLPFALWEYLDGAMIMPEARGWALAVFTAIFPSIISQVLFIRGTEIIGSNRAGLFMNLVPIFGTLMSVMILSETLETYHVAAMALVLGGIGLAERGK